MVAAGKGRGWGRLPPLLCVLWVDCCPVPLLLQRPLQAGQAGRRRAERLLGCKGVPHSRDKALRLLPLCLLLAQMQYVEGVAVQLLLLLQLLQGGFHEAGELLALRGLAVGSCRWECLRPGLLQGSLNVAQSSPGPSPSSTPSALPLLALVRLLLLVLRLLLLQPLQPLLLLSNQPRRLLLLLPCMSCMLCMLCLVMGADHGPASWQRLCSPLWGGRAAGLGCGSVCTVQGPLLRSALPLPCRCRRPDGCMWCQLLLLLAALPGLRPRYCCPLSWAACPDTSLGMRHC